MSRGRFREAGGRGNFRLHPTRITGGAKAAQALRPKPYAPARATQPAIAAKWQAAAAATKPCQMAFWNFRLCQT